MQLIKSEFNRTLVTSEQFHHGTPANRNQDKETENISNR